MSLQGTLETIPLSDVLSLLAATKKTGELRVTGPRGDGRLWLAAGEVVEAAVPRAATPVDAVFELLRLTAGTFAFEGGATAPKPGDPAPVAALLSEAQARLDVWRSIEAVVPSTASLVSLAGELSSDDVTVSRQQWRHLVAVAAGGDVHGVMERLGVGEFDACRAVKDLVDAGLVTVAAAPAPAPEKPAPLPTPPASSPAAAPSPSPAPTAAAPEARPPAAPRKPEPQAPAAEAPPAPRRPVAVPAASPRDAAPAPTPSRGGPPRRPAGPTPGNGPEPRRTPAAVPSREEAEELVHQLASLTAAPAPPRKSPERPAAETAEETEPEAPARDSRRPAAPAPKAQHPSGNGSDEEPINRGMLLKFLSSVRP